MRLAVHARRVPQPCEDANRPRIKIRSHSRPGRFLSGCWRSREKPLTSRVFGLTSGGQAEEVDRRGAGRPRPAASVMSEHATEISHLVSLSGAVGEAEARSLAAELQAKVRRGERDVLIDITAVEALDPLVLAAVLRTAAEVAPAGGLVMLATRRQDAGRFELRSVSPGEPHRLAGLHPALDEALDGLGDARPGP